MNISKDKKQKLVLVTVVTVGVLAALWFGLLGAQRESLSDLAARRTASEKKLQQVKLTIQNAARTESELEAAGGRLRQLESGMASGDLYAWAINTIRQFKLPYKIDIPQFSQIDGPKDMAMLPAFPYKQATITIAGTAYFYDLGRFIADFENQFPYMRIQNLSLTPGGGMANTDREKLSFKMDIVALVKPGPA